MGKISKYQVVYRDLYDNFDEDVITLEDVVNLSPGMIIFSYHIQEILAKKPNPPFFYIYYQQLQEYYVVFDFYYLFLLDKKHTIL